jgi:hypothetical protein
MLKKKIWDNFQLFTQKIGTKLSKIWVWDPRSGIRKNPFRIPDSGVKKAPDPGSGSATLNYWMRRPQPSQQESFRNPFFKAYVASNFSRRTWSTWEAISCHFRMEGI